MQISCNSTNLSGRVQLPASKSLSNRALIIKSICKESFEISNLSNADDTKLLGNALARLNAEKDIDCGDGGTVIRFLTAYLSTLKGEEFTLGGSERLEQRPIAPLVEALRVLQADINYTTNPNRAPIKIMGKDLFSSLVNLRADISSQFISALCLIAPALDDGISIGLEGHISSRTYIQMTLDLMEYFGVKSRFKDGHIDILQKEYEAKDYTVENDWSSACFVYIMAILSNQARLKIENLSLESIQGDVHIAELTKMFGVQTLVVEDGLLIVKEKDSFVGKKHIDLSNYPDLAVPLIVACAVKFPQISFSGLDTLKYKESDRLKTIGAGLEKFGVQLIEESGNVHFEGKFIKKANSERIKTHDDHRIAMSFSLLAVCGCNILIDNPDCVSKSFPKFYEQLQGLNFIIS